jgi:hypothetical protein
MEVLVINSSPADISLQWEKSPQYPLAWSTAHNHPLMAPDDGTAISVPSRDWLLGKGN